MLTDSEHHAAASERLSALMDGELDRASLEQACGAWSAQPQARSAWHVYHLIGDVLRSDDLASDPAHDAAFVRALGARLAREPVVLAPSAAVEPNVERTPAGHAARLRWAMPSAVAAGFVAVAGVLLLTRSPGVQEPGAVAPALAQLRPQPADAGTAPGALRAASLESQPVVASGALIRDAQLDRYLDAHKQFAGSSALGVPSAYLRSATTVGAHDR